ncbi:MAG: 30S ribosomal protein S4e [Nitrososphaerales archaeon]|nr:30S ribosomal protein S4e [Nitrososphaerales archaeon]
MGKKGGRNKLKRLAAPKSWDISRKESRFVFKPLPGPHGTKSSYPLGVVVRDLASMAGTSKEVKRATKTGKVIVDGKPRQSPSYPVGLFDVVSVPAEGASFRLVPSTKGLVLSKVGEPEAKAKLCSIKSKVMSKGGHMQYGFHDGRSLVDDSLKLSPGDAVLLEVPSQKVVQEVRLAKGSLGLVLSGDRAGQVGKILDVKPGTITRERMVKISLPGGEAEIPSRLVFPVGKERPLITVGATSS